VETEKAVNVFYGHVIGARADDRRRVLEWFIGVEAAGRSLEHVAWPLTAAEEKKPRPRRSPGVFGPRAVGWGGGSG
jgi:hypothetical protein